MRKTNRIVTFAALLVAMAWQARATELTKLKDWDKTPEAVYLTTDDEKKEWKTVKTEEAAEKFVALFWARRDPDIKTPGNEFKSRFDALVAKADELFKLGSKRGAMTERGRAFILIGPPKAIENRPEKVEGKIGIAGARENTTEIDSAVPQTMTNLYTFKYEPEQLPAWTDMKTLKLSFRVEPARGQETALEAGQLKKLSAKAVQVAVVNPTLKEPPVYKTREQLEAEMKAAAEAAAEKDRGPELSAPVRQALEKILAKEPHGALATFPLAYRDGATRLVIQIQTAASAVAAPEAAKLVVLIKAKDGKDAARREEPAKLQKDKENFLADRALPIVPGDYELAAALVDGTGAVLASGRRSVTVPPLPTEFAMSPIFLAYNDVEMPGVKPDDPFVFAMRKFLSRGDGMLDSKKDGLSYAIRVYNPGIDPVTRKTALKRSIRIKPKKGGAGQEVPLPPEDQTTIPEVKEGTPVVVVDLAGNIVEANLGEYFRPAEFELKIKVTDDILKKSVEATVPFTVVGPPPAEKPVPKKK